MPTAMRYPIPENEAERIRALHAYRILDTPFEQEYDDIAALAAEICGTKMAFITLIDEARQWFKARVGSRDRATARELAFCAHAICQPNELTIVPDARLDHRFADYPNVTCANGIRFYAGAPLVTPEGFALGTLCVADRQPRELTPNQERALRVLRRHIVNALELRRALNAQEAAIVALQVAQGELEAQRQGAVAATEAKSRFLATMTHEIRTPLSAIAGLSQWLGSTALSPEQREALSTIRTSSDLLLRLVNDILDLARVESGRLELEITQFDPRECVRAAVELVRPAATAKHLITAAVIGKSVPPAVRGDVTRVTQILINLLSNAVKFTARGSITLQLDASEVSGDAFDLQFAVTDTGIGLDPAQISRLFLEFSQAEASTTRVYGGTGLGLAISRRLVELHGGRIRVDSVPGSGSTFSFTIRVQAALPADCGNAGTLDAGFASRHPCRVLVVEDNEVNLKIASFMLQRLGFSSVVASNGREALTTWRAGEFDLVLMDVEMPEMDGLTATAEIRRDKSRPQPMIVMLTAHSGDSHRARFLQAGADDHIAKPLRLEDLAGIVAQAARRRPAEKLPRA